MKKFSVITILATVLLCAAAAFATDGLPEISGWTCGEVRTTKLDTVSGYKGQWLERDYRTAGGTPFRAVWIEGAGQKGWNASSDISESNGDGTSYKTLEVSGNKAILERDPVMGPSLIIKVARLGVLTLESSNVTTDEELIHAAEILIKEIK